MVDLRPNIWNVSVHVQWGKLIVCVAQRRRDPQVGLVSECVNLSVEGGRLKLNCDSVSEFATD